MEDRFQNFTILINRISRSIHRIKAQEMQQFGLKSAHVSCLYYLYKKDGLSLRGLCDCCEEDKAFISRALKDLSLKGYLVLNQDTRHYKYPIFLTEKGKEISAYIGQRIDDVLYQASLGLKEEERGQFYELLSKIDVNLSSIVEEGKK